MRKVKDILRLKFEAGLSHERIATALGLSKGAVTQYLQRAARAGVSWPVAPALDDTALEALLCFHRRQGYGQVTRRPTSRLSTRNSIARA